MSTATPATPAPGPVDEKRATFEREALVHLDSLYRVALRLTGNAADADDLVQETMLKAYRAWDQYEKGTNAKGWLLTILRNAFINEYRRRTRHPETVDLDTIEPYSVFSDVQDDDPQGTFFDRIVDDEVLRAIDQLPEQFRETVVLSDVEGLSYEEIARIIDVPVGTVKSRLFRARRLLQRSEEHTSESSHSQISYAVFCLKKKKEQPLADGGCADLARCVAHLTEQTVNHE